MLPSETQSVLRVSINSSDQSVVSVRFYDDRSNEAGMKRNMVFYICHRL